MHGGSEDFADGPGYRIDFNTNGWFDVQADCRRGSGIYEVKGVHIALALIKTDHSVCKLDSRADGFLNALESVRFYRLDEGKLIFDSKHESPVMVFHSKQ